MTDKAHQKNLMSQKRLETAFDNLEKAILDKIDQVRKNTLTLVLIPAFLAFCIRPTTSELGSVLVVCPSFELSIMCEFLSRQFRHCLAQPRSFR